jgi:hypothetical protein
LLAEEIVATEDFDGARFAVVLLFQLLFQR